MKGSYVIHLLSISTMNKLHDTYGSILKRLELTIATHQFYKLSDFSLKLNSVFGNIIRVHAVQVL